MLKQITAKNLQLIRCFIGNETYCLDTFWVKGVQNSDELTLNKNSETPIGWLTYENQKVPVFSLAMQLKRAVAEDIFQSKIILFNSKPMWGILVDRVSRVFETEQENLFPLPKVVEYYDVSAFQGIVKVGDEILLYLAPQYLHPQSPKKLVSNKKNDFNWEVLFNQKNKNRYGGQILTFSIGNWGVNGQSVLLGLSITQVVQVLKTANITPIPIAPDHILGLINWQNVPVPVVDLSLYLGLEYSVTSYTDARFLIARAATAKGLVAFPVEPLVKTLSLPIDSKPTNPPFLINKPFLIKSFTLSGEILVILDIDGIIALTTSLPSV